MASPSRSYRLAARDRTGRGFIKNLDELGIEPRTSCRPNAKQALYQLSYPPVLTIRALLRLACLHDIHVVSKAWLASTDTFTQLTSLKLVFNFRHAYQPEEWMFSMHREHEVRNEQSGKKIKQSLLRVSTPRILTLGGKAAYNFVARRRHRRVCCCAAIKAGSLTPATSTLTRWAMSS